MKKSRKKKWWRFLLYLVTIIVLSMLCNQFYIWINGNCADEIRDWVDKNLMIQYDIQVSPAEYVLVNEDGRIVEYEGEKISKVMKEPRWSSIKVIFFNVMYVAVVVWATSIFVAAWIYADRRVKRVNADTNRVIRNYMMDHCDITDLSQEENPELLAQMADIRLTMQRSEQMLRDEAARKNDLIVYLAHDLKTPLTSVIGYLSLLQEVPEMPAEKKAQYIDITLDKALRLEKLINEFFDITRYNLQQIVLEKEKINLNYMLIQMTDEFWPIFQAHGNTVKLQAEDDLGLYGDPEKLARVFNNILKNAVAYSYPGTEIRVFAEGGDGEVKLSFQNTGKTIPKYKLEAIFEKFFRLDESRSTDTGCAGLGLAISKEIITLHGGAIWAESENELTTFYITLPTYLYTADRQDLQ